METDQPMLVAGEEQYESIMERPFSVRAATGRTLSSSSRVRFDMVYTIQYNLKVGNMGMIMGKEQVDRLIECWDRASTA